MMCGSLAAVVLTLLVAPTVCGDSESRDLSKGKNGKAIADWLEVAEKRGFRGAVLAAKEGQVVAAVGVGFADEAGVVPNTPATLFEIASLSKQFTAAAALRLADKGKIDLDDPMAEHLFGVPEDCAGITLRHLLQHSSGIPGTNSHGGGDDLAAVLPSFLAGGPKHEPGTHWEYWNQGYAIATEVIALAAGSPFVDFCKKELFEPAKLKTTRFTGDQAPKGATVAIGRSTRGASRSALSHPYGNSYGFQYRGMGGVVTTVWDLYRWDRALARKLLKPASTKELFKAGLNDYALGWFVRRERGRLVQSHGGGVRGFVCQGRRYPEDEACLFVLSNDDSTSVGLVAAAVEQLLFGESTSLAYPDPTDAKAGEFLVGEFRTDEGARLSIEREGQTLRARVDWRDGNQSRMVLRRDEQGAFAVYVNQDRYALEVRKKGEGGEATVLGLWGRTFVRD